MEITQLYNIMAETTGSDLESLNNETILRDLDGWDSLAIVQFLALVDEQLGISVPARQINGCATIADLYKLLKDKVG